MDALSSAVVFLVGLALGSFLNVCISRVPENRSVVAPRSACPACGTQIAWLDNLPVISWFVLRRRCRTCNAPISARYPVVELASALLILACYANFNGTWLFLKFALFAWINLGLFWTDSERHILPDQFTMGGLAAGLALSIPTWVSGITEWFFPANSLTAIRALSFFNALFGAAVAAALLYLIGVAYRVTRGREGMGFGDVKLAAMFGAFLGAKLALLTIFLGAITAAIFGLSLLAVIYRKRRKRFVDRTRARLSLQTAASALPLPFGSFLALASILSAFYGPKMLDWYWQLF
ncbi:MAG: A24 family peptidase [Acidobacteriaceae bacterium]